MTFAALPVWDRSARAKAFKAAVYRHLREAARDLKGRLTYFQHADDLEVDFVFEDQRGLVAVDVTSGWRLPELKLKRFRQASNKLGTDRRLLVHGGLIEETAEGIVTVPIQRFLLDSRAFFREESVASS